MANLFQMNLSKKCKRDENARGTIDDDVILVESATTAPVINESCQHVDQSSGDLCREYHAALCLHCRLLLCYTHVELHRLWLLNERDQLIDELNERIARLNQLTDSREMFQKILFEESERKLPFVQQLSLAKVVNVDEALRELKQLFDPVQNVFQRHQCVSLAQIKKIRDCFRQFDENKKVKPAHPNELRLTFV